MALTDNTTFYGKDAEGFFKKVLNTGVAKNELTLIPNVKSKIKIAKVTSYKQKTVHSAHLAKVHLVEYGSGRS